MKKILLFLVVFMATFTLCGCGGGDFEMYDGDVDSLMDGDLYDLINEFEKVEDYYSDDDYRPEIESKWYKIQYHNEYFSTDDLKDEYSVDMVGYIHEAVYDYDTVEDYKFNIEGIFEEDVNDDIEEFEYKIEVSIRIEKGRAYVKVDGKSESESYVGKISDKFVTYPSEVRDFIAQFGQEFKTPEYAGNSFRDAVMNNYLSSNYEFYEIEGGNQYVYTYNDSYNDSERIRIFNVFYEEDTYFVNEYEASKEITAEDSHSIEKYRVEEVKFHFLIPVIKSSYDFKFVNLDDLVYEIMR